MWIATPKLYQVFDILQYERPAMKKKIWEIFHTHMTKKKISKFTIRQPLNFANPLAFRIHRVENCYYTVQLKQSPKIVLKYLWFLVRPSSRKIWCDRLYKFVFYIFKKKMSTSYSLFCWVRAIWIDYRTYRTYLRFSVQYALSMFLPRFLLRPKGQCGMTICTFCPKHVSSEIPFTP
jgi:hypothetical protein